MAEEKKKRAYSEARKQANLNWDNENLERISIAVAPGDRDRIKAAAAAVGESMNAYIKGAVFQRMERGG